MGTDARIGLGATVKLANNLGALTALGEPISVSLPNPQVSEVEATHFQSADRRREYIAGLIEDGEVTFGFNYVPGGATETLIMEALDAGAARGMEVVLPDGATGYSFTFNVIVKGWERDIPIDDRMTATLTARVTGPVTAAAVAP